jgi:hypothetical protein
MSQPGRKSVDKARAGILQAMSDLFAVSKKEAPLLDIANAAGYKAVDDKSVRTAVKELTDQGIIVKVKGPKKGGNIQLT